MALRCQAHASGSLWHLAPAGLLWALLLLQVELILWPTMLTTIVYTIAGSAGVLLTRFWSGRSSQSVRVGVASGSQPSASPDQEIER